MVCRRRGRRHGQGRRLPYGRRRVRILLSHVYHLYTVQIATRRKQIKYLHGVRLYIEKEKTT
jgi:hypothetical protein